MFLLGEKQMDTMDLIKQCGARCQSCAIPTTPHLPAQSFHLRDIFLRKCSKFENIRHSTIYGVKLGNYLNIHNESSVNYSKTLHL